MSIRVLLVDDDSVVRSVIGSVLTFSGFKVTTASSVAEALSLICSDTYDVLLSDLHMPGAGDGLTVVSAMRHSNPNAVTLLLSAMPQMAAASQAIVMQADEVLTKPMDMGALVEVIRQRVAAGPVRAREVLGVDEVLDRHTETTMQCWINYVNAEPRMAAIAMSYDDRVAYLPQLFHDLIKRVRSGIAIAARDKSSIAATLHGVVRRQQGYTAAMLVEESRMLQLSIFETLQNNLDEVDCRSLLSSVMIITDEINSSLSQSMTSFLEESTVHAPAAVAYST